MPESSTNKVRSRKSCPARSCVCVLTVARARGGQASDEEVETLCLQGGFCNRCVPQWYLIVAAISLLAAVVVVVVVVLLLLLLLLRGGGGGCGDGCVGGVAVVVAVVAVVALSSSLLRMQEIYSGVDSEQRGERVLSMLPLLGVSQLPSEWR